MAIVVHGVPGSPYVRSVLVTLEEKHAPYRFDPVPASEIKQTAHLARHPFGRVPAFEHDVAIEIQAQEQKVITGREDQQITAQLQMIVPAEAPEQAGQLARCPRKQEGKEKNESEDQLQDADG